MYRNTSCKLQAHRGVSTDAPENTMAAFRAAVEQGYDLIEFDPKSTKDGVIVVLHDPTLNRTGRIVGQTLGEEKVPIKELTFAELSAIDVGEWFDKRFTGEHIPTLAQTLDYMRSVGMEAKIDNVVQKFTPEQIETTFDIVEKHGEPGNVGLTCSDLALLRRFAERFPTAPLHYDGPVNTEALDELAGFCAGHTTTVWMRLSREIAKWNTCDPIDENYEKMIRERGMQIGIWILSTDEQMQQALAFSPDIVETTGGIKP